MKKVTKLILAISISLAVATTSMSFVVSANEDIEIGVPKDGIYAEFSPKNAGGTWDGELEREAAPDGKGLIMNNDHAGNVWGFYAKNVKAGVYKVAYYLTMESVEKESDDRVVRFKPFNGDTYLNYTQNELNPFVGKKIIIVTLFKLNDDAGQVEIGLWKGRGWAATLDKIVLAESDYNFANDPEYELADEKLPQDHGGDYTAPDESEWVPSQGSEDPGDETPITSDISMAMYLLLAGAAALGGLRLRKNKSS